jgi:hypothetical protein
MHSHRKPNILAATDLINFTKITITTTQLTRILDRLIREVSAYVTTSYEMVRSSRHQTDNSFLAS